MHEMNAFERQLSGVVRGAAPPSNPVDVSTIVRDATTTSPNWRLGSVISATKIVVAGATVALFGGFLLAGVLTQPSDERPAAGGASASAEAVPQDDTPAAVELPLELPADAPGRVDAGTLDTPIGSARWVQLSGDADALPRFLRPIPVPGGFVTLDLGHPSDPTATLWFSSDLVEWTRRSLPVENEAAELSEAGGEYWLSTSEALTDEGEDSSSKRPSLWRSADTLEWEAVDLTGIGPAWPAAIVRRVEPGAAVASGDAVVVPVTYVAANALDLLGVVPDHPVWPPISLESLGDGSYAVHWEEGELARVMFEAVDEGLRVRDAVSGEVLTDIEGVGMDFIERWAAMPQGGLAEQWLVLVRDGRVESAVELPEPSSATMLTRLALLGGEDGFRALRTRADGLIQTWISADGLAWTLDEVLGDDPGEPESDPDLPLDPLRVLSARHDRGGSALRIVPDGLVAEGPSSGGGSWAAWRSADGIEWQLLDKLPCCYYGHARLQPGVVVVTGDGLGFFLDEAEPRIDVDFEQLPEESEYDDVEDGMWLSPISANTVVHSLSWPDGQRQHWVFTFDELTSDG